MDASSYYFKKNIITGSVLLFFIVALMILGSNLGYYQNAVQAQLTGLDSIQKAGIGDIQISKNILINLLIFVPVIILAVGSAFNAALSKNPFLRILLLPPMIIYGASVYLDIKSATPFSEKFNGMDAAIENILFIPFIICFTALVVYMLAVIIKPNSMVAKVIGSITMVIAICFYVIFGVYVIYLQAMSALSGSFSMDHFILYLVCFGLDVTTFFLMLSLVMSFSAMNREDLLWAREVARRRRVDERRRQEREEFQYEEYDDEYEYDEYGEYMVDEQEPEEKAEPDGEPEMETDTDEEKVDPDDEADIDEEKSEQNIEPEVERDAEITSQKTD